MVMWLCKMVLCCVDVGGSEVLVLCWFCLGVGVGSGVGVGAGCVVVVVWCFNDMVLEWLRCDVVMVQILCLGNVLVVLVSS